MAPRLRRHRRVDRGEVSSYFYLRVRAIVLTLCSICG
jgi:hypothetical protein